MFTEEDLLNNYDFAIKEEDGQFVLVDLQGDTEEGFKIVGPDRETLAKEAVALLELE